MRKYVVVLAFFLVGSACGGGSDSAELEALREEVASLKATTTAAPTTTGTDEDQTNSTGHPQGWPDKITFGFVPSSEQEALQDNIQPFMDVLSEALGIEVEGVVTTDYTGLVTAMGTGKADLGAFGPFGYTLAQQQFGNMEVLIQAIRYGSATYHGQWMTNDPSLCDTAPESGTALENTDNGVVQVGALEAVALQVGVYFGDSGKALGESVDAGDVSPGTSCMADLRCVKGKRVAFTSESSTSGYLFPALQLIEAGIDPVNDITPIFTGGHDAAVFAVYNGDADVGVSYDDARRSLRKEKTDVGDKVIVFNVTGEVPNDVVAASSLLPDSLQNAVYDAIYAYLETEEGEAVFDEAYGWTSIRRAAESDFDIVRKATEALGITEPDAAAALTVTVLPTTREPQCVSGPYGLTADDEYPYGLTADDEYWVECMLTGAEFLEFISALAFTAASSTSHSELGLYFVLAQDELLGDRAAMTATMFLCEGAYPRLFQSTISIIGDWIDACSQVSSYSATSTDERCMRLTDSASAKLSSMTGRLDEVAEFIG